MILAVTRHDCAPRSDSRESGGSADGAEHEQNGDAMTRVTAIFTNRIKQKTRTGNGADKAWGKCVMDDVAGGQPARAGPILEATCCKKALGNDSILIVPGAGIVEARSTFVNRAAGRFLESFCHGRTGAGAADHDRWQGADSPQKSALWPVAPRIGMSRQTAMIQNIFFPIVDSKDFRSR